MRYGRKKFGADLSIIIPAAGDGKRMRSSGPKSLLPYGQENIIGRQIRILKNQYPKSEIIVVVGFQADKIIKVLPKEIKVVENEAYGDTTIVRSILIGLRVATHNNIIILNGDLIFNKETLYNLTSNGSTAIIDSTNRIREEEIGLTLVNNNITCFAYGLKKKWGQIIFLNGKELDIFKTIVRDNHKKNLYTFEILNKVIDKGGIIKGLEPKGMKIAEIDSIKDMNDARKLIL